MGTEAVSVVERLVNTMIVAGETTAFVRSRFWVNDSATALAPKVSVIVFPSKVRLVPLCV